MDTTARYEQCLEKMYGLHRFGIILGLSTIRDILDGLGNPQDTFRCIHVAGTNGKGSVASALANILHLSGYRVGLYTSPHLIRFNERICINGKPIADDRVLGSYEAVCNVHQGDREPTFFEFTTAMALYEFGRAKVDWAVIETGMGGRLDATNLVNPSLTLITNISLEHQLYLGNTIAKIAGEKAGIIKQGIPVITGAHQKSAVTVIESTAREHSAPVFRKGKDFRVRRHSNGTFAYSGIHHSWKKMRTGLLGRHQVDNAALVLAACDILTDQGIDLPIDTIRKGLMENKWPGRLEVIFERPTLLLDGAHNMTAVRHLARHLTEQLAKQPAGKKITLVSGILDDKAYPAMLKCLLPLCHRAILTQPKIDRSLSPDTLYPIAKTMIDDVTVIADVPAAVNHALHTAQPDEVVCVAGSLYLVGEVKAALENGAIAHKP